MNLIKLALIYDFQLLALEIIVNYWGQNFSIILGKIIYNYWKHSFNNIWNKIKDIWKQDG